MFVFLTSIWHVDLSQGITTVGNSSCLGSNSCEKSSGIRSIENNSCDGFKSCECTLYFLHFRNVYLKSHMYYFSHHFTPGSNMTGSNIVGSNQCIGAKECMSNSGNVITEVPTNSLTGTPTNSPSVTSGVCTLNVSRTCDCS